MPFRIKPTVYREPDNSSREPVHSPESVPRRHAFRSTAIDLAVGVFATAFGVFAVTLEWNLAFLLFLLPGVIVAIGILLLARALGAGLGAFDYDELPGPVSIAIGLVVNVLVWALLAHGARRLLWWYIDTGRLARRELPDRHGSDR